MNVETYKEITEEAINRIHEYLRMDEEATHTVDQERKESFLSYWISVVAFEKGFENGRKAIH